MDKKRSITLTRPRARNLEDMLQAKGIKYTWHVLGHAKPTFTYYFTCGKKDYKELKEI